MVGLNMPVYVILTLRHAVYYLLEYRRHICWDSRCTKFLNDRVWSLLYLVVYCTLVVHTENTLKTQTTHNENQKSVRYEDEIKAKCFKHCVYIPPRDCGTHFCQHSYWSSWFIFFGCTLLSSHNAPIVNIIAFNIN